eukprot:7484963-Ditylum_brightwellii.AAC.1
MLQGTRKARKVFLPQAQVKFLLLVPYEKVRSQHHGIIIAIQIDVSLHPAVGKVKRRSWVS